MSDSAPAFAVVGDVNKGKSSIVSTFSEDDSVGMERRPGSTTECERFHMRADRDGPVLYTLVDTPGFHFAVRALDWMRRQAPSAADRRGAVERFVQAHRAGEDFKDECKLLEPILDGAAILYVVDGSIRYNRVHEAEMEILQWTGQPRMALINRIGEEDHEAEWRQALDQYFSLVRPFDAHEVGFDERIKLLQAFRELRDGWRAPLEEAIDALQEDWERRRRDAARAIADLLVDEVTYTVSVTLGENEAIEDRREKIEKAFHDALRKRMKEARRAVEALYRHRRTSGEEDELEAPVFDRDLFAQTTWELLGLTQTQLLVLGTMVGAVTGGVIDVFVGGASFGTGALVGGLLGFGSTLYHSVQRLTSLEKLKDFFNSGSRCRIGPHKSPQFPWIVLDLALLHYFMVRDWAHSRRAPPPRAAASGKEGIVARLSSDARGRIGKLVGKAVRNHASVPETVRQELADCIEPILTGNPHRAEC